MHVILLNVERSNLPFILFTQSLDFLLDKGSNLACKNGLSEFGTPYHMVAYLVSCMLGSFCFHTITITYMVYHVNRLGLGPLNPRLKAVGMQRHDLQRENETLYG
jgi:hypothetical protein